MTLSESEKDEILDAVADQIADLLVNLKNQSNAVSIDLSKGRNSESLTEVKQRISALESRVEKKLQDYEIITNSIQNQLSEKVSSLTNESRKEDSQTLEKIDKLRTAVIRLSNEIKEIKVQLATMN